MPQGGDFYMKNKGIGVAIIVAIVVGVAAAGAGGYMVMTGGENEEGEGTGGENEEGGGGVENEEGGGGEVDNQYVGTGTETFSGTWEGEGPQGDPVEGSWEFAVDWDNNDVTGWFEGDAYGDIDGSVSEGEITAEGEAALGLASWWGSFTADGSGISGEWEIEEQGVVAYSGTWSGQEGALEEENKEEDEEEGGDNIVENEETTNNVGDYSGSWESSDGTASGKWNFTVYENGELEGSGSGTVDIEKITGTVSEDGKVTASGESSVGSVDFTGTISSDGSIEGEWEAPSVGFTGTWQGSKES